MCFTGFVYNAFYKTPCTFQKFKMKYHLVSTALRFLDKQE